MVNVALRHEGNNGAMVNVAPMQIVNVAPMQINKCGSVYLAPMCDSIRRSFQNNNGAMVNVAPMNDERGTHDGAMVNVAPMQW
jgi:hypothetical protein